MPSRQPSKAAPQPEENSAEIPRRKRAATLPIILGCVGIVAFSVYFYIFKLPNWRERWAFQRIRAEHGFVELKQERGRKFVEVDLSSVEAPTSDLESLNAIYPVERLVVSRVADDSIADQLGRMTGLRYLKLDDAAITDASIATLEKLPNLSELSVAQTQLTESGVEQLAKVKGLTRLNLTGLAIRGSGLAALKDLTKLQEIRLQDTPLDDAGLAALGQLANLRKLKLARTRISDAGLSALADLKRLESLELDGTSITDKGLEELKSLTRLTELSLNDTRVSNAGLEALKDMTNLDTLRTDNTRMTPDKVQEFMSTRKISRTEVVGGFKREGEFPDEIYFGFAGVMTDGGPMRGGVEISAAPGQPNTLEEETAPNVTTSVEWSKTSGKYSHHRLPLGDYIVFARCGDFYDMRWVQLDGTKNLARYDFILNRGAAAIVEIKLPEGDPDPIVTLFELKRDKKNADKTNESFPVAAGVEIETVEGKARIRIPSGTYKIGHGTQVKQISPRGKEVLPVEF